jgi:hypothetical protein
MLSGGEKKTAQRQLTKIVGAIILFTLGADSLILAQDPYQRLVRRFEMPDLGFPNPAGIAFSPVANSLLLTPSPAATKLIIVTFAPDVVDSATVATTLVDPVNMAFNSKFNALFFWDANLDELVEIKAGDASGLPEPSPEAITRFNAKLFDATQSQGMTFDPETGDLFFLVDSGPPAGPRLVLVTPDPEMRFDGETAQQNGRILSIALTSLPPSQLRGIAFNPRDGHLYITSPAEQRLYEVTSSGELLTTRDLSSFEDISPSELTNIQNIVFAPSGDQTDDPAIMNLYMADNGVKSEQGLGDIFELSLTRPEQIALRRFSIDDVTTREGDNGTVNAVFTVTLSGASQQTVTVDYTTEDGTATAASDYVSSFGSLTFDVGDTSKQIIVGIKGDVLGEMDETFFVNLTNTRGFVSIADGQGTGTIIDDDRRLIDVPADYTKIQEAFDAAADGDTILLAPGIYQETLDMANKSVVLASWFLTTRDSSYISRTIVDGGGRDAVITIRNTAGPSTKIIGLTIRNGEDGISPRARFDIVNCLISDCSDGIDYEAGSGGLCRFNLFENNSDDGIDLDNAVDIIIEGNVIRNNEDDGIEIRLQPYDGSVLNYIIRDNEIYGNGEDGIQLIDYDTLSDRMFIIAGNLIYDNRKVGLGCMSGGNTTENFEGASIPERIFLFNNTFAANAYGVTGGDSLVALNNIFVDHAELAMKNIDAGSIIAHSLYWNNGSDFGNCNVDSSTILFSDPLLDRQLRLRPTSPAIDAGTASFTWQGETVLDLPESSYIGMSPDLGAFEFDGIPAFVLKEHEVPRDPHLKQNYPNPFNPATRISYSLPLSGFVTLIVYDTLGREVQMLVKGMQNAGTYSVDFDAGNLASGIYFYTLRMSDAFVATKKMLLLR